MMRVLLSLAALLLVLASASSADARALTKRDARAGTINFMDRVAWAFDHAQSGERVHVRPAFRCLRISHVTVTCPVTVTLPSTGAVVRGYVRVHRTRQGLLGYLLPWDPDVVADTLGKPTGSDGIPEAV